MSLKEEIKQNLKVSIPSARICRRYAQGVVSVCFILTNNENSVKPRPRFSFTFGSLPASSADQGLDGIDTSKFYKF